MYFDGLRVKIKAWSGLEFKVAKSIFTAHQCRRIPRTQYLTSLGRNVADSDSNATVVTAVWLRRVRKPVIKNRYFSGFDGEIHGSRFIDASDLLPSCEHIVLMVGIHVRHAGFFMASG